MTYLNRTTYNVKSNAKINLGLNVLEKTENDYHNIDTFMIPIDLYDTLNISIYDEDGDIFLKSNNENIPLDDKNTMCRAYKYFFEEIKMPTPKVEIFIEKKIPQEAGLGGGSSNAAELLKVLNTHYKNILSDDTLIKIGLKVGSDVPFFIKNRAARVKKMGDEIDAIEGEVPIYNILLIKPKSIGVSTKLAYETFDNLKNVEVADIDGAISSFKQKDVSSLVKFAKNNLEQAILKNNFEMEMFKNNLNVILGSRNYFMSGSGSTYFTFIDEAEKIWLETRINTFFDDVEYYFCKNLYNKVVWLWKLLM